MTADNILKIGVEAFISRSLCLLYIDAFPRSTLQRERNHERRDGDTPRSGIVKSIYLSGVRSSSSRKSTVLAGAMVEMACL